MNKTTKRLNDLAFVLGSWANECPMVWRKRIYQTAKVLAGLATVLLLVLPLVSDYLPANVQWGAVLTAIITFLGHLADRNTHPFPEPDVNSAPEPTP